MVSGNGAAGTDGSRSHERRSRYRSTPTVAVIVSGWPANWIMSMVTRSAAEPMLPAVASRCRTLVRMSWLWPSPVVPPRTVPDRMFPPTFRMSVSPIGFVIVPSRVRSEAEVVSMTTRLGVTTCCRAKVAETLLLPGEVFSVTFGVPSSSMTSMLLTNIGSVELLISVTELKFCRKVNVPQ
jgi:hypothetical protein